MRPGQNETQQNNESEIKIKDLADALKKIREKKVAPIIFQGITFVRNVITDSSLMHEFRDYANLTAGNNPDVIENKEMFCAMIGQYLTGGISEDQKKAYPMLYAHREKFLEHSDTANPKNYLNYVYEIVNEIMGLSREDFMRELSNHKGFDKVFSSHSSSIQMPLDHFRAGRAGGRLEQYAENSEELSKFTRESSREILTLFGHQPYLDKLTENMDAENKSKFNKAVTGFLAETSRYLTDAEEDFNLTYKYLLEGKSDEKYDLTLDSVESFKHYANTVRDFAVEYFNAIGQSEVVESFKNDERLKPKIPSSNLEDANLDEGLGLSTPGSPGSSRSASPFLG